MTDTIRERLDALSAAATPEPWEYDSMLFIVSNKHADVADVIEREDAALITELRNAYARGDLIPRDEVEGLVEALVSAADDLDSDTRNDYGNGDDLSVWLVQRDNLDALRVAKNAAADYLASIKKEESKLTVDLSQDRPYPLKTSLVWCAVCFPKSWSDERKESWVNSENPAGTTNGWRIGQPGDFAFNGTNSSPRSDCPDDPNRIHIVFVC